MKRVKSYTVVSCVFSSQAPPLLLVTTDRCDRGLTYINIILLPVPVQGTGRYVSYKIYHAIPDNALYRVFNFIGDLRPDSINIT